MARADGGAGASDPAAGQGRARRRGADGPKRRRIAAAVLLALCALLLFFAVLENGAPMVTELSVPCAGLPEGFEGFRIAQVSDLHNAVPGGGNDALLALLAQSAPDLIAITGDLIDSRRPDVAAALAFVQEAARIAPVYYVTGNHEARAPDAFAALERGLAALSVRTLRDEAVALCRGGGTITLVGLDDPAFHTDGRDAQAQERARLERTLARLHDGEGFALLLTHRPEYFEAYAAAGVSLTLAGHAHGGQIRLPFLGGLYAPGQGFFPAYDAGLYRRGGSAMAVSRGLGNSILPLRINNRPELVVVTLLPSDPDAAA